MRSLRLISGLLASTMFFVVSCSTASIVAGNVLIVLDERHMAEGDQPHQQFSILARSANDTYPIPLQARQKTIDEDANVVFRLPAGTHNSPGYVAAIDDGTTHYTYVADDEPIQTVQLQVTDYDHYAGSYHYTVHDNRITPIFSRQNLFLKTGLSALPYGIGFGLILNLVGRALRRREKGQLVENAARAET